MLLRGKALRDATVLRLLAAERFLRALVLIGIGYVVLRFRHSEGDFQSLFNRALPAAQPLANVFHFDLSHSPTIAKLRHLLDTKPSTLLLVAFAVFGYAAINLVEGIGLWLLKRWGEYFSVIATSIFLPLEIYELTEARHLAAGEPRSIINLRRHRISALVQAALRPARRTGGVRGGAAQRIVAGGRDRSRWRGPEARQLSRTTTTDSAAISEPSPVATEISRGRQQDLAGDGYHLGHSAPDSPPRRCRRE